MEHGPQLPDSGHRYAHLQRDAHADPFADADAIQIADSHGDGHRDSHRNGYRDAELHDDRNPNEGAQAIILNRFLNGVPAVKHW
jgi:hypothetical protein